MKQYKCNNCKEPIDEYYGLIDGSMTTNIPPGKIIGYISSIDLTIDLVAFGALADVELCKKCLKDILEDLL